MTQSHYLVTGASSGLGKLIAEKLIASGCKVTIVTTRSPEIVRKIHPGAEEIIAAYPDKSSDQHLTDRIVEIGKQIGAFNGFVHCAGGEHVAPLRLTKDDSFDWVMGAALMAFALLRAAAATGTMNPDSSIVLLSSVAASRGAPGMVAYSAAKGAIEAMARSAAVELAPRLIRVNCVAPGAFLSPMHHRINMLMPEHAIESYSKKHPLGFGSMEDVAAPILFLLSPAARWITGTVMTADGGFLA